MFCVQCGAALEEYNRFCASCGTAVEHPVTAVLSAEVQAARAEALNEQGVQAWREGDIATAAHFFTAAAELGHHGAMRNMGVLFKDAKDFDQAEAWYLRSIEAGNADAPQNLGHVYYVLGRETEAEAMWQLGVDRGDQTAAYNLGYVAEGRGNMQEAIRWYEVAAAAGVQQASENLSRLSDVQNDWASLSEVAALNEWFDNTDFGWLGNVQCTEIPQGNVGWAEATHMLRLHALYRAVRSEFPNLPITRGVVTAIVTPTPDDLDLRVEGPLLAAWDHGISGCYPKVGDVVAAATLGRTGSLEAVLVACDLLCHRYNFFGGDGRPLIDEYRYLLPAVASFTSAASTPSLTGVESGPGWWDEDGCRNPAAQPNLVTRALGADPAHRRALIGDNLTEQLNAVDFVLVAQMLAVDVGFLDTDERTMAEGIVAEWFGEGLTDDLGPDEMEWYERGHTAFVVAQGTDALCDAARDVAVADREAVKTLEAVHAWVSEWGKASWRYVECWPEGPLGVAIASSPSEWFRPGRPT